jgi:hypothetical protein
MLVVSRLLPLALLAALALLLSGCGGETSSNAAAVSADVAELVPADAQLVLALETDPESEQWRRAEALLDRFPGKQALFGELSSDLSDEGISFEDDVLPAVGDQTYVVIGDVHAKDSVLITQPRDPAKLAELLRKSDEPSATRELNGWTLVAENDEALAAYGQDGEKLADADWFADAQDRVAEEALVTMLVNGPAVQRAAEAAGSGRCATIEQGELDYAVGTVTAEDDGVRLLLAASGEGAEELVGENTLLEHVPSGALVYLGAPGLDATRLGLTDQLRCALDAGAPIDPEALLGTSLEDVLDLFAGGLAAWVRPAALIPEVGLLLEPEDAERAVEVIDTLVERGGGFFDVEATTTQVGDIEARELRVGPVIIRYGAGDGRVVITTATSGFDALTGEGGSLEDDEAFRDAREAAGVGDDAEVFAYADIDRLVELVTTLAAFGDSDLPAEVEANLEPLESVVAWGDLTDPNEPEAGVFLAIR